METGPFDFEDLSGVLDTIKSTRDHSRKKITLPRPKADVEGRPEKSVSEIRHGDVRRVRELKRVRQLKRRQLDKSLRYLLHYYFF